MEAVRIVAGTAVPLDRSDVDTDQIIPADWLKRVERTGFDKGLFSEWRDDRDFVLNDERFAGATHPRRPAPTSAPARRASTPCGRSWTTASRPWSRPASPTSSATTARRTASCPVQVSAEVGEQLLAAVEADPTLELTDRRRAPHARGAGASASTVTFPLDDSVARALPRGPRRHRHHPAPRRRHHRLRGGPPGLARRVRLRLISPGAGCGHPAGGSGGQDVLVELRSQVLGHRARAPADRDLRELGGCRWCRRRAGRRSGPGPGELAVRGERRRHRVDEVPALV